MRLVLIPLWVTNCLHREGKHDEHLLDKDTVAYYMSKADMNEYQTCHVRAQQYFESTFGISQKELRELGAEWSSPFRGDESIEPSWFQRLQQHKEEMHDSSLFKELIGRQPIDSSQSLKFAVRDIPSNDEEDVIGVYAHISDAIGHQKREEDRLFMSEFLETLYAHQCPFSQLAMSSVMGSYLTRLSIRG